MTVNPPHGSHLAMRSDLLPQGRGLHAYMEAKRLLPKPTPQAEMRGVGLGGRGRRAWGRTSCSIWSDDDGLAAASPRLTEMIELLRERHDAKAGAGRTPGARPTLSENAAFTDELSRWPALTGPCRRSESKEWRAGM